MFWRRDALPGVADKVTCWPDAGGFAHDTTPVLIITAGMTGMVSADMPVVSSRIEAPVASARWRRLALGTERDSISWPAPACLPALRAWLT